MKESTFKKYCLVIDEWFINGFNGVKAYQRFYPRAKDKTADKRFRELTEIDRIQNYLNQKRKMNQEVLGTSHEALLKELNNWAYADITNTISLSPAELKQLPVAERRLIKKVKHITRQIRNAQGEVVETIDVTELQFVDKVRAMDMINRHTGFYDRDNRLKAAPVFLMYDARK